MKINIVVLTRNTIVWEIILIILLINFGSGCMDYVDLRQIKIQNNSKNAFYYFISENDSFTNQYKYLGIERLKKSNVINVSQTIEINERPRYWDRYFNECKDKKMRLFIIDFDSASSIGLDKVISHNIFTKRILIDEGYLNSINWTIVLETTDE